MHRRLTAAGLAALLVTILSGCATDRYLAANLPPEWQADPTENARTLDLVKIATPTVQSDVIGPGDVFVIEPGHDAWVNGNVPCILYGPEDGYAKPR